MHLTPYISCVLCRNSVSILGVGKGLPWTNQQADAMKNSFSPEGKQGMLIILYAKHIIMTHRMYYIIVYMCTSIVSAHCCHQITSLGYAGFSMNAYTYNVYYLSCTYSSIPSPISPPHLNTPNMPHRCTWRSW